MPIYKLRPIKRYYYYLRTVIILCQNLPGFFFRYKVGCVFSMVAVSMLPHAEFGPKDHREDAPNFNRVHFLFPILDTLNLGN